jgi:hypothetical protein
MRCFWVEANMCIFVSICLNMLYCLRSSNQEGRFGIPLKGLIPWYVSTWIDNVICRGFFVRWFEERGENCGIVDHHCLNKRENRRGNQEWTIQKNKLATLDTLEAGRRKTPQQTVHNTDPIRFWRANIVCLLWETRHVTHIYTYFHKIYIIHFIFVISI